MLNQTPATSVGGSVPPDEFVRRVRDALTHLYEPAHLLNHPLRVMLAPRLPQLGDPARNLRDCLLDAIESLEPAEHVRAAERERRPYAILVDRYVGGFTPDQIVRRMHISERQFRRDHHKGLQAVAALLWAQCDSDRMQVVAADGPAGSALEAEIQAMQVELLAARLAEVVESVRGACESLSRHYGVALALSSSASGASCLRDETLAKQALLSCISSLIEAGARHIAVEPLTVKSLPGLRVVASPLPEEFTPDDVEGDMAVCQSLMQAQGGRMRLEWQDSRAAVVVWLLFRPDSAAHVLVVDDNERVLRLYERYLASGRYRVSTANSAADALAFLDTATPDAIVLDVMMRETDGWELLRRLRAREALRSAPIIVCSVLDEPTLAYALGADDCLRKPVMAEALLKALARLAPASSLEGLSARGR